jgi:hypothetical protein
MSGFSWHKRRHAEMLDLSRSLTPVQTGFLNQFIDLFCSRQGVVRDDDRIVSGLLNRDIRQWRRIKAELIAIGELEIRNAHLFNGYAEKELHEGLHRMENARRGGSASQASQRDNAITFASLTRQMPNK